MRKGTRSCVECRRRKLRCLWPSQHVDSCQRCLEKRIACSPQTQSPGAASALRMSSKQRITKLEWELSRLSQIVNSIEVRLPAGNHTSIAGTIGERATPGQDDNENDDTDDASSISEIIVEEPAARMSDLFQNDWLSTDQRYNNQLQYDRRRKAVATLLDEARFAMQKLIPTYDDVHVMTSHVSHLLVILAEIFPSGSLARSQEEMLASYESMQTSTVDSWSLASWLLALALVCQQLPTQEQSPTTFLDQIKRRYSFARTVCETVEKSLLSHDSLLGTVKGLEIALLYMRVNMSGGNMQKTWLYLRRVTAIAELIGLPRAARADAMHRAAKDTGQPESLLKTHIWESICAIDRMCGLLNGFPIGTRLYPIYSHCELVNDGKVQPLAYLLKLSSIAMGASGLDDLNLSQTSSMEIYAAVLKLDGELRALAASATQDWWHTRRTNISAADILRFFHCCVMMQIHLPFVLRADPSKQYTYSKMTGIEACQTILGRWRDLRDALPFGFFLSRVIDVQAFTATIVLVLSSHSSRLNGENDSIINVPSVENIITQTVTSMEQKAGDPFSSDVVRQAVASVRALQGLLSGKSTPAAESGLKLTVPLLGTIHVRRQPANEAPASPTQSVSIPASSHLVQATQCVDQMTGNSLSKPGNNYSTSQNLPEIYPFSFSIIQDSDVFQDQFLYGDTDLFDQWQYDFTQA